jgi:hypothetical protein
VSGLGGIEDDLLQAAYRGRVFYDTSVDHRFTIDGRPVDSDTGSRLETLIQDGFLTYARQPDTRYPQPSFLTGVVTTPKAWEVMDR